MKRVALGLICSGGGLLIMAGVLRQWPDLWLIGTGTVLVVAGALGLLAGVDVLADYPEDEDEEWRRRRGQAGWQKPVAPPRSDQRPRGLPPRGR